MRVGEGKRRIIVLEGPLVVPSNTIGEDLLFFSNHFMVLLKLLAISDKDFMAATAGRNRDIKQR